MKKVFIKLVDGLNIEFDKESELSNIDIFQDLLGSTTDFTCIDNYCISKRHIVFVTVTEMPVVSKSVLGPESEVANDKAETSATTA